MILNVFKTGINAVSFLPVFYAVFLVFLTAQYDSGKGARRALPESSITIYFGERKIICIVYFCHHTQSHFSN